MSETLSCQLNRIPYHVTPCSKLDDESSNDIVQTALQALSAPSHMDPSAKKSPQEVAAAPLPRPQELMDQTYLWIRDAVPEGLGPDFERREVLTHFDSICSMPRVVLVHQLAQQFSCNDQIALSIAALVEWMHVTHLFVDDLQDGDLMRKDQPALWTLHGPALTVNFAIWALSQNHALIERFEVGTLTKYRLTQLLHKSELSLVHGQTLDIRSTRGKNHNLETYRTCAIEKNSTLLKLAVDMAQVIASTGQGSLPSPQLKEIGLKLKVFFDELALLHQMTNDALDLCSAKGRKPGGDLKSGKISFVSIAYRDFFPSRTAEFECFLKTPPDQKQPQEVEQLLSLMKTEDFLEHLDQLLVEQAEKALQSLQDIDLHASLRALLEQKLQRKPGAFKQKILGIRE